MDETFTSTVLPLKKAYPFGEQHGLGKEINALREMEIEWDSYSSSLRRGYVIELFEEKGLLEQFLQECWPEGLTDWGHRELQRCRGIKRRYLDFLERGQSDPGETEDDEAFAAETDLRDFLAQHLDRIEKGLRLYERDGRRGIEFAVDDGRIDLLAIDKNDRLVVIELKVSRGRNRALGQLVYYMAWVDKHMGHGPCRGMVIAKDIGDVLKLAVQRISDVSLYAYSLSVNVSKVA